MKEEVIGEYVDELEIIRAYFNRHFDKRFVNRIFDGKVHVDMVFTDSKNKKLHFYLDSTTGKLGN
ncbi:MAG: hypothetical protein IJ881_01360 [Neisseriaceae bacterium]|nr:hypothetical protein [Neisseriaceae bacterium]MBR3425915.1 hypothetical protein [Neisseriaceae bacterium]